MSFLNFNQILAKCLFRGGNFQICLTFIINHLGEQAYFSSCTCPWCLYLFVGLLHIVWHAHKPVFIQIALFGEVILSQWTCLSIHIYPIVLLHDCSVSRVTDKWETTGSHFWPSEIPTQGIYLTRFNPDTLIRLPVVRCTHLCWEGTCAIEKGSFSHQDFPTSSACQF